MDTEEQKTPSGNKRSISRIFRYYRLRAIREKGTSHKIALGWALGVCVGFAIPFGLQLVVSIPLSFLLKCSKLGATAGTFVTNHFSIFIIYPFQTWLGNRVIGGHMTLKEMETLLKDVFEQQNYASLFDLGIEITISFLLGGVLLALVSTPIAYYVVRGMVARYRLKAALRKKLRKQKRKK